MRLASIAYDMQRQATRNGVAIRDLETGLRLQYKIANGARQLTLARPATLPTRDEEAQALEAFSVPLALHPEVDGTQITYTWPAS